MNLNQEATMYNELSDICKKNHVRMITATQFVRPDARPPLDPPSGPIVIDYIDTLKHTKSPLKPGDRVKAISRAAAGSAVAGMFGYPEEGCYILSEGVQGETLTPLAGSVGKSPLIALGERLDGEWTPGSMI